MTLFPEPTALLQILRDGPRRELPAGGYVRAAVLVSLTWNGTDYDVLLTRRTEEVETHKGQVSFPGGVREESDRTAVDTALREAQEELGLSPTAVRVAGLLDDLATPTGFVITPVVGLLEHIPPLVLNTAEVVDIFRVSLSFFAREANGRREQRTVRGREYEVWHYTAGGHEIWGATATIIRGLVSRLRTISPRTPLQRD